MRTPRAGLLTVFAVAGVAIGLLPSPAMANGGGYGGDGGEREGPQGGTDNGDILASVPTTGVRLSGDTGEDGSGNLVPSGSSWTPPVCWYEPVASPSELAAMVDELERTGDLAPVTPSLSWYHGLFREYYADGETTSAGGGGYENFNLDREGEGMWWRGTINPHRTDEYGLDGPRCDELMFWADLSEAPGVEDALTPEILAGYAYDAIAVPETEFELNPAGAQVVNLDTWIWGEAGSFEPVTVRAELPGTGLWAETTARPVSFTIDPGTADARVHPSRDGCPISGDGTVGSAYTEGADVPPPCGVTYRRAAHHVDGYRLTAAVTWEISWTGTGVGEPQQLPRAVFETTRDIEVREVQAVVRP